MLQPLPPRDDRAIRRIVIVGGGTAGWMAAAPLAQRLCSGDGPPVEVVLVESPEIGTIGVGEATLPPIRWYNQSLGLDGADFIRRTQASFKLGIEFADWGWRGNRFFHGFGDYGPPIDKRSPHHHWLRLRAMGYAGALSDWSMSTTMAAGQRFAPPQGEAQTPGTAYSYAFHFDASLYAAYLREYAVARGAQRIEGRIVAVEQRPGDGFVAALTLADGRRVEGDLFVDCSGFRALLIEGTLQAGFEDWSALLPCDRALAVPSERRGRIRPYTTSTARAAGWQWRIPLQHRTGNGHVYCSAHMSDDEAARELLDGLDTPALDDPRPIRFTTGRRREAWVRNVVAVGLSAGFVEPLESTSIQLIMDGVGRLIELFPDRDFEPALAAEYNRRMQQQFESVRDFIVLHYKLTRRDDSDFWRRMAAMPIPDRLAQQIELFRASAHVAIHDRDGFLEPSWLALLFGLGEMPRRHDPGADRVPLAALQAHLARWQQAVRQAAAAMPDHSEFIERHVRADAPPAPAATPA